jgi:hypothetical protein
MGRALLVVLKLIRDVGGKSALLLFCGDSKKSNKLIEMVRDYVDALQEFGTHGARFNYPIPGYTTEHQCWMCYGQLADTDTVVQPVFEAIGFQPDKSFLDIGIESRLCTYVPRDLSANSIAVAQEQVTEEWRKRGAEMFRKNIVEGWNKLSKEEQDNIREEKRKKREEKGKRKRGAEVS